MARRNRDDLLLEEDELTAAFLGDDEMNVTEFELQLWRVFNGFMRWVEECERYVNNTGLDGYDLSILHIVRMKNRPKSVSDIGKILNRTDHFNVQYSIKN